MAVSKHRSRSCAPSAQRGLSLLLLSILCLFAACSASSLADLHEIPIISLPSQDAGVDLPHLHTQAADQASPVIEPRDSPSSSAGSIASASPTASSSAAPRPFDTSLGSNFTQASCPMFFNSFLGNSTFKMCNPFSLLLQNSNAFFQATGSNSTLNPVLDSSCSAPFAMCAPLMASLATQLTASSNCGADFQLGNPLVVQAYRGLLSFAPMYNASCLKADPSGKSTGKNYPYCYASSLNSSSGADSMLYFLPLGLGLPGGTSISCSSCTQQTMAIYANAATDTKSPLNTEYLPAANMINSACDPNFVSASVATSKSQSTSAPNAASRNSVSRHTLLISILAGLSLIGFA